MKKVMKICLFLTAIVIAAVFSTEGKTVEGIMTAYVIGGMYTDNMAVYRKGLAKKMEKLVWDYGKWSKFIGFIDVKKYKEKGTYAGTASLKPTGNLIEVVKDFEREGGIAMDIPVKVPLTGQGRYGTAPMRGHEEKRKLLTKKVRINQLRHAVEIQDNKMSPQMLKKPEIHMGLMERGSEDLKDWFTRKLAFFPYQAILSGYDDHLIHPVNGVNVVQKSHPNFYVRGNGKVNFSGVFNATYETAVATALSTLGAGDEFNAATVRNMVYLASKHGLQPVAIGGNALYPLFIHPAQARQLRSDTEFIEAMKHAASKGEGNSIFTGQLEGIVYEGAYIIIDNTIPGARVSGDPGYSSLLGTVNYGSSDYMLVPRDTSPKKLAIICGQSAITAGYGSQLDFTSENADYGQFLGDEANMIVGFERADIIDDDNYMGNGSGSFYGNFGSIVLASYSPDDLTTI